MSATLVDVPDSVVLGFQQKLKQPETTLPEKYRILFSLRSIRGNAAHDALMTAMRDVSALFRHDVAFCLGQRQDPASVGVLTAILHDTAEHAMVRHEAGEALGAIGTEECLQPLREHLDDDVREVAETCQLALQRVERLQKAAGLAAVGSSGRSSPEPEPSRYLSVDPAPAAPAGTPIGKLRETLLDEDRPMFERYSALFALRNRGGAEAVEAMGAVFPGSGSALLKHEVAYVMGQLQDPAATQILGEVLKDTSEHAMVRHEAAEALGAIAQPECEALLRLLATDPEPVVAHSCVVALDMLASERSGEFQYAAQAAAE